MCSLNSESVLRDSSIETLQSFSWSMIIDEMKAKAPISLALLQGCTDASTSEPSEYTKSIIGVIFAILLRNQKQCMNLVQRIISVILYYDHAKKQVSFCMLTAL